MSPPAAGFPALVAQVASNTPLAPAWLVLPMAVVTLLAVAAHMHAMHRPGAEVPRSRRIIRSINSGLMLVTVPALAYAFGIVTPARPQAFALAWTGVILLLTLIILVAMADVFNTWRLHAGQRRTVSTQIKALRSAMAREVQRRRDAASKKATESGPSSEPPPADDAP